MYFLSTRMIVTVGSFPSHNEWNWEAAQPSRDARQQSSQWCPLCATGFNHSVKLPKCCAFFPTMAESSKPIAIRSAEKSGHGSSGTNYNITEIWKKKPYVLDSSNACKVKEIHFTYLDSIQSHCSFTRLFNPAFVLSLHFPLVLRLFPPLSGAHGLEPEAIYVVVLDKRRWTRSSSLVLECCSCVNRVEASSLTLS